MDEVHDSLLISELLHDKFHSIFHNPRNKEENGYRKVQKLSTGNRVFGKKVKTFVYNGRQVKVLDIQEVFSSKLKLHDYIPEVVIPEQQLESYEFQNVDFTADVNKTPMLHLECAKGNISMVRMLIDNGAKVNKKQENGNTALMEAVYEDTEDHLEITRLLLSAGADFNHPNYAGFSAVSVATARGNMNALALMLACQSRLINPEFRTETGMTPLIMAAVKANSELIQFLVDQCQANVLATTVDGQWTAYNLASTYTTDFCMKYLGGKLADDNKARTYVKKRMVALRRNCLDPQLMLFEMVSLPPLLLLESELMPPRLRRKTMEVLMAQSDAVLDDHDSQCYLLHRLLPWFLMLSAHRCHVRPILPDTEREVVKDFFALNANDLLLKCVEIYHDDDLMMFNFTRIISFLCKDEEGKQWVEHNGTCFQRCTKVVDNTGKFFGCIKPPFSPKFNVPCVQLIRCETAEDTNGTVVNVACLRECIRKAVADRNMNELIEEDAAQKKKREKKRERKKRRQQRKQEEAKEKMGASFFDSSDESDADSTDNEDNVDYGIFSTQEEITKTNNLPDAVETVKEECADTHQAAQSVLYSQVVAAPPKAEDSLKSFGFTTVRNRAATNSRGSAAKGLIKPNFQRRSFSRGGRPVGMHYKVEEEKRQKRLKKKTEKKRRVRAARQKVAWPAMNEDCTEHGTYVPAAPLDSSFEDSPTKRIQSTPVKKGKRDRETYQDFMARQMMSSVDENPEEGARVFRRARGIRECSATRIDLAKRYGRDLVEFPELPCFGNLFYNDGDDITNLDLSMDRTEKELKTMKDIGNFLEKSYRVSDNEDGPIANQADVSDEENRGTGFQIFQTEISNSIGPKVCEEGAPLEITTEEDARREDGTLGSEVNVAGCDCDGLSVQTVDLNAPNRPLAQHPDSKECNTIRSEAEYDELREEIVRLKNQLKQQNAALCENTCVEADEKQGQIDSVEGLKCSASEEKDYTSDTETEKQELKPMRAVPVRKCHSDVQISSHGMEAEPDQAFTENHVQAGLDKQEKADLKVDIGKGRDHSHRSGFTNLVERSLSDAVLGEQGLQRTNLRRNQSPGRKVVHADQETRKTQVFSSTHVPNIVQNVYKMGFDGSFEGDSKRFIIHLSGSESDSSDSESSISSEDLYSSALVHSRPGEPTTGSFQTGQLQNNLSGEDEAVPSEEEDNIGADLGVSPESDAPRANSMHSLNQSVQSLNITDESCQEESPVVKTLNQPQVPTNPSGSFFPSMPDVSVFTLDKLESIFGPSQARGRTQSIWPESKVFYASELEANISTAPNANVAAEAPCGNCPECKAIPVRRLETSFLQAQCENVGVALGSELPSNLQVQGAHSTPGAVAGNPGIIGRGQRNPCRNIGPTKSAMAGYQQFPGSSANNNQNRSIQRNVNGPQMTTPMNYQNFQGNFNPNAQIAKPQQGMPVFSLLGNVLQGQTTQPAPVPSTPWFPKSLVWNERLQKLHLTDPTKKVRFGSVITCQNDNTLFHNSGHGLIICLGIQTDGREVALKRVLKVNCRGIESWLAKLRRLNLDRTFLASYLECVEDVHFSYLTMELFDYNLPGYLTLVSNPTSPPPVSAVLPVCFQVLCGLQALHDVALLHMNLKPTNVLIDGEGRVKLADYGLFSGSPRGNHQHAKQVLHPKWCPTEVLNPRYQGQPYTPASDVQVAGMLIHYTLTGGVHPYGNDQATCQMNIKNGNAKLAANLGDLAHHLFSWMLLPDMAKRRSVSECLTHPLFWENDKRCLFLAIVADEEDIKEKKAKQLTKGLDTFTTWVGCEDWVNKMKPGQHHPEGNIRTVYQNTVSDLLRYLSDEEERYRQLPAEFQASLVYPRYQVHKLYPRLFLSVYDVVYHTTLKTKPLLTPFFPKCRM